MLRRVGALRPRAPRPRRVPPGRRRHAAHVPGGEAGCRGRLHVDGVVVEEEHPVAGDREPCRHGVEDGGVGLDQAELEGEEAEGEGLGQRDRLVVGRPLEGVHVGEEAAGTVACTAATSSSGAVEGGLGPAAECLEEGGRLQVELPVVHHPGGELLGRAPPGLEAAHPAAARASGSRAPRRCRCRSRPAWRPPRRAG